MSRLELLRALVERSASLRERLTDRFTPAPQAGEEPLIEARLAAWCQVAGRGDEAVFRHFLALQHLDLGDARRAVSRVRWIPGAPLPAWTETLSAVLDLAIEDRPTERCMDVAEPVPFEEVLAPFVTCARALAAERAGAALACFSSTALGQLERQLLRRLSRRAVRSLSLELHAQLQQSPLDALASGPSREKYQRWATAFLKENFAAFCLEYSVLARLLTQTTELWVDATVELVGRFHMDRAALATWLGAHGAPSVERLDASLSDPHDGLRSVVIITLDSGERAVYKPRPLGIETAWNRWVAHCEAPVELATYSVLERGLYGWAQYVARAPAEDSAAGDRYFYRAGELMALVHALAGLDCHAENVVQAGEDPVLVDVETLLSHEVDGSSRPDADARDLARRRLVRSVLYTYLLPLWSPTSDGDDVYDGSGLGAGVGGALSTEQWVDVNTDRMRLGRRPTVLDDVLPCPMLRDGSTLRVEAHEAAVVSGFSTMLRLLIKRRRLLLACDGPLAALSGLRVRFVYRATNVYHRVLDTLTQPEALRDGVEHCLRLEVLAKAALEPAPEPDREARALQIFFAERAALYQGDVPSFGAETSGRDLMLDGSRSIPGWFDRSSLNSVRERIEGLDEVELAFQVDLIRASLHSRSGQRAVAAHVRPPRPGEPWLDLARSLARSIAALAIRSADGSVAWLQPLWSRAAVRSDPRRGLDVVNHDLYDGAVGIALFLAATERVSGGDGLRSTALGAVQPLLRDLEERSEETAERLGVGGLSGLGSVVYGLARMAGLLGEPALLAAAERAADLITPAKIDADDALDVTHGSAGALLGLLALVELGGGRSALRTAAHCGARLLRAFEGTGDGHRSVRTLGGQFLSGFSHGAAGIAYALCRLYAVTGESALVDAARAAIAFERSTFCERHGNWPDLRWHGESARFGAGWCHGAPGIALGRVGCLASLDDVELRQEIERALAITSARALGDDDHLCCGAAGAIDVLRTAASALDDPALADRAEILGRQVLARSLERGGYRLGQSCVGQLQWVGLYTGLAGIGYAQLRAARPELVPELLLLR